MMHPMSALSGRRRPAPSSIPVRLVLPVLVLVLMTIRRGVRVVAAATTGVGTGDGGVDDADALRGLVRRVRRRRAPAMARSLPLRAV